MQSVPETANLSPSGTPAPGKTVGVAVAPSETVGGAGYTRPMPELADDDLIRYAYHHQRRTAAKVTGIRERFGLSETRFLQAVNQVIDDAARLGALEPATAALARRLDVQRTKVAAMRKPA